MKKRLLIILLSALTAVTLLTGCSPYDVDRILSALSEFEVTDNLNSSEQLVVDFIDVGQGDSILIELPDGENMLIDAGTTESYNAIDTVLQNKNISEIDYLVGTHPHADHIGSMDKVIQNYEIGEIYMPGATNDTRNFENVLKAVKAEGKQINTVKAGMTLYADDDIQLVTLAPNSDQYDSLNNYSAVIKLTYKNVSVLFTGDAETLSENEMLDAGYDLSADVLKMGHHGSSTSSSKNFLKAVNPKYAVISCGVNNSYNHPHKETLQKIDEMNIQAYRTDTQGTITLTTDGNAIVFTTEK